MIIKRLLLVVVVISLFASQGYCQDTGQLIGQVANIYVESGVLGNDLIAGFSVGGLIGGLIFSCIGFVAFIYGKRNAEYRPMITGILLMAYPYFVKNTIALYLVGLH